MRIESKSEGKLQASFELFPFFGLEAMRMARYWYPSSARLVDPPLEKSSSLYTD